MRRTGRRTDGRTVLLLLGLMTAVCRLATGQTIAITGGTIYPVSGPKIENGTLLLRDGKIAALGVSLEIPSGATRVDAKGGWITPGLIHGGSTLGLKLFDIGGPIQTQGDTLSGDVKTSFHVAEGLDPARMAISGARAEGVPSSITTTALRLLPGQAG